MELMQAMRCDARNGLFLSYTATRNALSPTFEAYKRICFGLEECMCASMLKLTTPISVSHLLLTNRWRVALRHLI